MSDVEKIRSLPTEDTSVLLNEHGPVFILGSPRSGTTFLSRCIASMEEVEQFSGLIVPPSFMHNVGLKESKSENTSEDMKIMREIFWLCFIQRCHHAEHRVGYNFRSLSLLLSLLNKPTINNKLFCYKEPFMGFALKSIIKEFPNAKFIHIFRNGKDNADSMVRSYPHALSDEVLSDFDLASQKNSELGLFEFSDGFAYPWWIKLNERENFKDASIYIRNIYLWKQLTSTIELELKQVPQNRKLHIRYEDMVVSQVETAHKLSNFMQKKISPALIKSLKKGHSASINISQKNQTPEDLLKADELISSLLSDLKYKN